MTLRKRPAQSARLVALHVKVTPAEHLLTHKLCLIGRADFCQVVIPLKPVSRLHAIIKTDKLGYYILQDNSSINGIYINGQRLARFHRLQDQDTIGFGTITPLLRFEILPNTPPSPPNKVM